MGRINNTPPVLPYLLAGALKLTGGAEFWTRALFFPFGLAAAWGLLALAARFLRRPLWPTLIVLAGPAWTLNMNHAMAEVVMAGFALPALWLAVAAADDGDARAWAASALLAALALLSKYNALFVLPPALLYARARGVRLPRLAAWAATALAGLALGMLWDRLAGGLPLGAAWSTTSSAISFSARPQAHRLRALLDFAGGLGLVVAVWGLRLRPSRRALALTAAFCALLFAPRLDLWPARPVDRLTGVLLAWGTCVSLWTLLAGPRARGAALWASWAAAVAALQLAYWAVVARFVVFLLPPLVFWLWERLEGERPGELELLGRTGFGAALALSLALGATDRAYASAQKRVAAQVSARWLSRGARVWYSGHWGLQEYLSRAGARQLDVDRGGWDEVRPGEVVVVSVPNTNRIPPRGRVLAGVESETVPAPLPIRLICGRACEGGFYSSTSGFLPWSLSDAPLDVFTFVERR
ncbi:MAG: glycosyltransferase family 39 protein [Elusimicrobia bacterium]|nr:glycosyltransferase family 39 protein [Elusimicrobiota bacterium]